MENKPFTREMKILLLKGLQRGYFIKDDLETLKREYIQDKEIDLSFLTEEQRQVLLSVGEELLKEK